MWLFVVAALLIAGIWVGGWLLSWPLWIQVVLTCLILLAVVGVFVFRRVRAVHAARALEREILAQADMQAATARPDRRAEILALQEQMRQGIAALKKSKLAAASGSGALYSLPWYMIVGPPGAGKTTALRHSGLIFPCLDSDRGGLKGLGGTRNCDWWFTNEAVLLDTAGRYATDHDDRDEWFAFLDLLKKYRSKAPINGVLVAVSVSDLAGQSEERIEQTARVLRTRIDEVIARLQTVVPVYVVFTKVDLINGFVESWEDLLKSERARVLGVSFDMARPRDFDPARAFADEFDLIVQRVYARAVVRIRAARGVTARAKVLRFPSEFAALKNDLCSFLSVLFRENAYQETPVLRGAYFTSGTQEGRPLDRVMAGMAQAFGLAFDPGPPAAATEPKSYFLTDMFQKVVFKDSHIAVRTALQAQRQMMLRVGIGGGAVLIALFIVIVGLMGYRNNQDLVADSLYRASKADIVHPSDQAELSDRVQAMSELQKGLALLDRWAEDGAEWKYRFGMYAGPTLRPAVENKFAAGMEASFVRPMKSTLEEQLVAFHAAGDSAVISPDIYLRYYNALKAYLMLTEVEHLDPAWATKSMGAQWADQLGVQAADRSRTEALIGAYFAMQKAGRLAPAERDDIVTEQVRGQLRNTPRILGDYERLMQIVRPGTAPISRTTVFGATAVNQFITSRKGVVVDGVYTRLGWSRVRKELDILQTSLVGEAWVLGEGALDPKKVAAEVRTLYFEKQAHAWEMFLRDLDVKEPTNVNDAIPQLLALTEPEWPYLRLARAVHNNVSVDLTAEEAGIEKSLKDDLKAVADKAKALVRPDAGAPPEEPRYPSPAEVQYRPYVQFAIPPKPTSPDAPPTSTSLAQYQGALSKLVAALTDHKQKGTDARGDIAALQTEFQDAYRTAVRLLAEQDAFTRDLLQGLLLKPISLSWASVVNDAAGSAGAFWGTSVYGHCTAKLHDKYPFLARAPRDASLQDFTEFFRPETGTLWAFYGQNVKASIEKRGSEFLPSQRFDQKTPYSSEFLRFLKRADEITNVFFDEGSKTPLLEFKINLHSVSADVAEVTLEIDGKAYTYKNTPDDWMVVVWPAKEAAARRASVRVRGFSGLVEEILNEGDFALFRLLRQAKLDHGTAGGRPGDEATIVATWKVESQKAEVKMDLKPARSNHPFRQGFFDDFRCPRTISDASK